MTSAAVRSAAALKPHDVVLEVAGVELTLDRSGAAWLAAERALIVADLHLEKGSAFAQKGVFLPPFDTRATLDRLEALIDTYRPHTLVALGDSFHDADCEARMDKSDIDRLAALTRSVRAWVWIEGNHDPKPPAHIGGETMAECAFGPLLLRHEPAEHPVRGEAAGHLHPCARIARRGRAIRRRCFISDGDRIILPALGAFAGGLNVCDEAYAGLFGAPPSVFMLGRDRVYAVSARQLLSD